MYSPLFPVAPPVLPLELGCGNCTGRDLYEPEPLACRDLTPWAVQHDVTASRGLTPHDGKGP